MNKPRISQFISVVLLAACLIFSSETASGQTSTGRDSIVDYEIIIAEIMPEFPGGDKKLLKFVEKEMNYPKNLQEEGIGGTIYVQFQLDSLGFVVQGTIKTLNTLHPALEAEAIRLVREMPQWKPAYSQGRAVSCIYNLPIRFK